jgi:hypothetical protein
MLHALPEANIEIDVAEQVKLLNTSLKAMSDLGVDKVHASDMVYVKLGVTEGELAGMHDLFSAFGLDSAGNHSLFAKNQQAGLVLDESTFSSLGAVGVQELVGQLSKLGFTEIDVLGDNSVQQVFSITAQTPVDSTVTLLGGVNADLAGVFDPDIFNKPIK